MAASPWGLHVLSWGVISPRVSQSLPQIWVRRAGGTGRGVVQSLLIGHVVSDLTLIRTHAEALDPPKPRSRYRLRSFASEQVDRAAKIGRPEGGTPALLSGLWWMDGNPLPDEVLSFADAPWDGARRQTRIVVYDQGVWTWHASLPGRALYRAVQGVRLVYELHFDDALSFVEIKPLVELGKVRVAIPDWLVRLTAKRVEDGIWLRYSYALRVHVHTYALRRIVRADGTREPAFADYVAQAPARGLVAERVPS